MTNGIEFTKDLLTSLITAFPPTLVALLAWRKGIKNYRALKTLHVQIDGRFHQLLSATKKLSKAEGLKKGLSMKRENKPDRRSRK